MMNKLWQHILVSGVSLGITVFAIQTITAQTWVGPGTNQAPNGGVSPIEVSGADNLGDHTATTDLDMMNKRIYNGGSILGEWALQATNTGSGVALAGVAESGNAVWADSLASTEAVYVENTNGSGIGIEVDSAGSISAYFDQRIKVDDVTGTDGRVQLGASSANRFSLIASSAGNDLYWGDKLLCDVSETDCGHILGPLDDNLGNHIAESALNLAGNRIFDVHDSDPDDPGDDHPSSLGDIRTAIDSYNSGAGVAFNAYSDGWHGLEVRSTDDESAGYTAAALAAFNSGTGYGLSANSSISGYSAKLDGVLRIDDDIPSNTLSQLTFNSAANAISQSSKSTPTATLYWGDRVLCDGTQANCGFTTGDPSFEFWVQEADGDLFSDKAISIGGPTDRKAKLEVLAQTSPAFTATNIVGDGAPEEADIEVQGNDLFLLWSNSVASQTRLKIYNIDNIDSISSVGDYLITSNPDGTDIAVAGDYAYISTSGSTDLFVYDISNPGSATNAAQLQWGGATNNPKSIVVSGRYAYVGEQAQFTVIDIAEPTNPQFLVTMSGGSWADINPNKMQLSGKYIYTADGSSGLHAIDISNPTNPVIVGSYDPAGVEIFDDLVLKGNILYTGSSAIGSDILHALDISNPNSWTSIGTVNLNEPAKEIGLAGNYLYLLSADSTPGIQVVDIYNPASMTIHSYDNSHSGVALAVIGSHLIISGAAGELSELDLDGIRADNIYVGYLETDNIYATNGIGGDNIYVGNGLIAGGLLTVNDGNLSTSGKLQIGDYVLTEQLLEDLLNWLVNG